MNFARYLKHLFYRTPLGDCVCSTEKYFTNKIVKSVLKNEKKNKKTKKMETAGKKNNNTFLNDGTDFTVPSEVFSEFHIVLASVKQFSEV